MKNETVDKVERILYKCVNGALKRTAQNRSHRPFHEALLTKELVTASSFERSFSTSFGQGPIEEISMIVAMDNGYEVERQKSVQVNVYKGASDEIERIMRSLRAGEKTPNWKKEVEKIVAYGKGDTIVHRVISDLWLRKNAEETYISIKTVKPNLDQTEIAKRDMLFLKANNPACNVYFGLFYNPGGTERKEYDWSIPSKIFDMHNDEVVLIGEDYWDTIGGSGTYTELLRVFEKVGDTTREAIRKL